jgi:hypothetical protein
MRSYLSVKSIATLEIAVPVAAPEPLRSPRRSVMPAHKRSSPSFFGAGDEPVRFGQIHGKRRQKKRIAVYPFRKKCRTLLNREAIVKVFDEIPGGLDAPPFFR